MVLFPNINLLKNIDIDIKSNYSSLFSDIKSGFEDFLGIKSLYNFKVVKVMFEDSNFEDVIFDYAIKEMKLNSYLKISIPAKSEKHLQFILFREILRCFIPNEFRHNNSINLIINQIVMSVLSDFIGIRDWRLLIRDNLELRRLSPKGLKLLNDFDKLETFFHYPGIDTYPNPIQFFFNYVNNKQNTLIREFERSCLYILFKDFEEKYFKLMIQNDLIETIRIIIEIFYKTKYYRSLLQYKNIFQTFKNEGIINTELSLRKFLEKMDWLKSNSLITPSYQINWNAINKALIILNISFNPLIGNYLINQILNNFPFIISPKISLQSFCSDILMYLVIPVCYLEDLMAFLKHMFEKSYSPRHFALIREEQEHYVNLNYFKEEFSEKGFINPKNKNYRKDLLVRYKSSSESKFFKPNLTFLDFLILDRIRWFSVHGIGFENRADNLKLLKSDLLNQIYYQKSNIIELKDILKKIYKSSLLKRALVSILDKFREKGFFYLKKELEQTIQNLKTLEDIIILDDIKSIEELNNYLATNFYSQLIEYNLSFKRQSNRRFNIYDLIKIYFKSETKFVNKIEIYEICLKLLKICFDLKIFDLDIIRKIIFDEKISQTLFHTKEKKLEKIYNEYQAQDITSKIVDSVIERLLELNPPVIYPILINTIITKNFEKDYLQLIFKKSEKAYKALSGIILYFPRVLIYHVKDIFSGNTYYYVEISTPALKSKELMLFISILYNLFKDDLIYLKNHIWSGFITRFSTRDFYDFEKKEFFYTEALYVQYLAYVESLLQNNYKSISYKKFTWSDLFWLKSGDISDLVKMVNRRKSKEKIFFEFEILLELENFFSNMNPYILNKEEFTKLKDKLFFQNFIKSISFIPAFRKFNLSQFVSYCVFNDMNQVEFNSFLIENLLKIEYPACLDSTIPILSFCVLPQNELNQSFLKPFNTPDKNIREYCGFFIKEIILLFHFQLNFTPEGLDYDSSIFKEHLQNVLFNKKYQFNTPNDIIYNFSDKENESKFRLDSPEYSDLCEIFDFKPIDIKSYIGTKKVKTVERIQNLLKKNLIFPYIKLKNLGFQENIYFFIPNLNQGSMDTLIKIFSWFNYGFIHKIEGNFYIQGVEAPLDFEYGLMMEIYFPKCELAEFKQLFDLVFEYLEIDYYLILKDFINGDILVKNLYEDPNFFDTHHPLRNVKNDGKDDNK
ncbi:MAG: hypothetical protein EU532_12510 [Promethearchaeota archaeon]|nr:MAG: hypothetical protein EU532_12510 [Candidatus Lokiarchaeota archaeon]